MPSWCSNSLDAWAFRTHPVASPEWEDCLFTGSILDFRPFADDCVDYCGEVVSVSSALDVSGKRCTRDRVVRGPVYCEDVALLRRRVGFAHERREIRAKLHNPWISPDRGLPAACGRSIHDEVSIGVRSLILILGSKEGLNNGANFKISKYKT